MTYFRYLHALVCGLIATLTMDIMNYLASLTGWINKMDPTITGRLADGWARGKFVYDNFAQVPEVGDALAKGVFAHYLIGVVCALGFVILLNHADLKNKLAAAIAFGLATTAFSAFLLFPSVGMGIFAMKSPVWPLLVRSSVVNHLFFGIGLYLGSEAWLLISRHRAPSMREAS